MSNFITNNDEKDLKKRLTTLTLNSKELKFLVGFFYFSGLKELYEALKNNNDLILKVLVGLYIDKRLYDIVETAKHQNLTKEEIINQYLVSLTSALNAEESDTKEFYDQVNFFIELMKPESGRLIIRKTIEPNHSKLYIFNLKPDQVKKSIFIIGSSNFTRAGLISQNELNVEISDYGVDEVNAYFDRIWENSIEIKADDIVKVITDKTVVKKLSPFDAYVWILKNYLESYKTKAEDPSLSEKLEKAGYKPYKYQIDAINQALSIIDKHNGVIIADVVGLGKTIIACAVAKLLNKRGIIICPPGLVGNPKIKDSGWNMYKKQFGLYDWEVWSMGDLEKLQDYIKKENNFEVVIVDEAHRFRNEDTKGCERLKNICRNKKVILLTATPFNNHPSDILTLLSLFTTPKKSTITFEGNLRNQFNEFKKDFDRLGYIWKNWNASQEDKKKRARNSYQSLFGENEIDLKKVKQRARYIAKQIRAIMEPVTIRRNRLDLLNNPEYKDEIKNISSVADPIEWFYELSIEQSKFYDRIITEYFEDHDNGGRFKGAIYRPFEYEKKVNQKLSKEENFEYQQQRNLFDFMRRLLVKRFESSFGAFKQSIENFRRINEHALQFIEKTKKYILDRGLLEKIYDLDIDEIEKYLIEYDEKIRQKGYEKNNKVYEIEKFAYKDRFIEDIKSDLEMFQEILDQLEKLKLVENDPKLDRLIKGIDEVLSKEPKRKIVIFSEYVDTVKHLEKRLKNSSFGNKILVVAEDLTYTKAKQVLENFDASYEPQKDDFDILLTSDKLSEGFNLNRAGMVINYDIPWNPVRVIQRVGRINRIGKKVFDELFIVNFFPTEQGAEITKQREIARNKMFLIHNALGEDAKIFDIDEEPSPSGLYQKIQTNPDKLEEESFYTMALKEFYEIKKKYPEIIEKLKDLPPRLKVAKKSKDDDEELLVFFRKSDLYIIGAKYQGNKVLEPNPLTIEDVFERIKCGPNEEALDWNTERFWDAYEKIKQLKEKNKAPKDNSIEGKALNIVKTLLNKKDDPRLNPYRQFLKTLKKDILYYGTLFDYTLRRIANIDHQNIDKAVKELEELKKELGEDYLEKEEARLNNLQKEIIIALENRRVGG